VDFFQSSTLVRSSQYSSSLLAVIVAVILGTCSWIAEYVISVQICA